MKKYEDIFRPGWNNFQRNNPTKIIGSGLKYEFVSILTNHAEDLMYPYKEQEGIPENFWLTTKGGKFGTTKNIFILNLEFSSNIIFWGAREYQRFCSILEKSNYKIA